MASPSRRARGTGAVTLDLAAPSLWPPAAPTLYDLTLRLHRDGEAVDEWRQAIGIRTVRTEGISLLLNDEPVFLAASGGTKTRPCPAGASTRRSWSWTSA